MSKYKVLAAAITTAVLLLTVGQSQASCAKPSFTNTELKVIPTKNIDQHLLSRVITKQTNYYRCLRGLPPLTADPRLLIAAKVHARNMARLNTLSHNVPVTGFGTVADRFKHANVEASQIRAENVGTEYRMVFGTGIFLIQDERNCRFAYRESKEPVPVHTYASLAESAVRNLWNSYSHRQNILNKKVKRVAAAAHFTVNGPAPCGTYYYSQDFAG